MRNDLDYKDGEMLGFIFWLVAAPWVIIGLLCWAFGVF